LAAPREYELVLMLDPQQDAPARDALAQQARGQIEAAGSLKAENSWGLRKMAYEINRRTEADYRWFRFEAPSELLDSLDHELKIADGVLRFRIFKVDPNTPTIVPPAVAAPGPRERTGAPGDRGPRDDGPRDEAPVESTPEPAAAEPAAE
jgi:small subunit ribosomal protein S6